MPKPAGPSEFPLAALWEVLTTRPAWSYDRPTTPQGGHGGPKPGGRASTSDTTANGGNGRAPGKGVGELPEDTRLEGEKAKPSTTGRAITGFDASTSRRIASGSSETGDLFQNADGSFTRKVSSQPTNFKAADGSWQPIDTSLRTDRDGRLGVTASGVQVTLAGNRPASWGDGAMATSEPGPAELVTITLPSGEVFGYSIEGGQQVAPLVSGPTAIYHDILPYTNVEVTALGGGAKETLVLESKDAASTWLFPLRLQGLTAELRPDGSVGLLDSAGKQVATIPRGYMQDSKFLENDGDFVKSDAVSYELVTTDQGTTLRVTADRAWLDDPARIYPVRVDPTATVSTDGDVYVDPDPNTGASDQNGTSIAVGWDGDRVGNPQVNDVKWSYIAFSDFSSAAAEHPSLKNMRFQSAWLNLFHTWTPTGACNTYRPVSIHRVWNQAWTVAGLQTATPSQAPGISFPIGELLITNNTPACSNTGGNRSIGRWVGASIQDLTVFNEWSHGDQPNNGLALSASGTDNAAFKRFTSENYGGMCDGRNCQPYLTFTYVPNTKPQITASYPPTGQGVASLTPELMATATDSESDALTYKFEVIDAAGIAVADSGPLASSRSWTVPEGKLKWAQSYMWRVLAHDGAGYSESKWQVLSVAVPQPSITSALSQNSAAGFSPSIGNYTTQALDAQIATVGPALAIQRSYNSRDPRTSAVSHSFHRVTRFSDS